MAFRRTDLDIPQDVTFPENLDQLGFKINMDAQLGDQGNSDTFLVQIVDKDDPTKFFTFEKYAKYETNQRRYDAFHKAVRKELYRMLESFGIYPLYFRETENKRGTRGDHVSRNKTAVRGVKILCSSGITETKNQEVCVVVGDSKLDLGISSRKGSTTESGLYMGSLLGLVSRLRHGARRTDDDDEGRWVADQPESDLPGIIILNPGELLWSHELKECMSSTTWQDRGLQHAFSSQYKVDEDQNRVPRHEDPASHVKTCLAWFLDVFEGHNIKLNIITVGDASEHVLAYLNDVYASKKANPDLNIAMIQPTHNAGIVTDPTLIDVLAKHGRIWEAHSQPKGTLLLDVAPRLRWLTLHLNKQQAGQGEEPVKSYANSHDVAKLDDRSLESKRLRFIAMHGAESKDMPLVLDNTKMKEKKRAVQQSVAHSAAREHPIDDKVEGEDFSQDTPDTPPGELSKRREPIEYFRHPGLTMAASKRLAVSEDSKADNKKEASKKRTATEKSHAHHNVELDEQADTLTPPSTLPIPIPIRGKVVPVRHNPHNLATEEDDAANEQSHATMAQGATADGTTESTATMTDAEKRLAMSSLGQGHAPLPRSEDRRKQEFPTSQKFSAGVEDTADMILPAVMDDVLAFFKSQKERRACEKQFFRGLQK